MTVVLCPSCKEGEIDLTLSGAPRTHHYPGHLEIEDIHSQSCSCDTEPYASELIDAALEAERHAQADDPRYED